MAGILFDNMTFNEHCIFCCIDVMSTTGKSTTKYIIDSGQSLLKVQATSEGAGMSSSQTVGKQQFFLNLKINGERNLILSTTIN